MGVFFHSLFVFQLVLEFCPVATEKQADVGFGRSATDGEPHLVKGVLKPVEEKCRLSNEDYHLKSERSPTGL